MLGCAGLFRQTRAAVRVAVATAFGAVALPLLAQAQPGALQGQCYDATRDGELIELKTVKGKLAAIIAPRRGGEMVGLSYVSDKQRVELLYKGMDFCTGEGWGGKAPILWPATGRNFNKQEPNGQGWVWKGQNFPMPIHGFARDLPWNLVKRGASASSAWAKIELQDTASTRKSYPFGFTFQVTYRVSGDRLSIKHEIIASPDNDGAMPFSIGNHITFRQPLVGAGEMKISTLARQRLMLDQSGKPTDQVTISPIDDFPVPQLGTEKAWALTDYATRPDVRLDDPSGIRMTLSHTGSQAPNGTPVLFNLWSNADAGFFSPEPWLGRQNSLVEDNGLVKLEPGSRFTWTILVSIQN